MVPVMQIPVVPTEVGVSVAGWRTKIRCPGCEQAEIVYNGNYFCGDWDFGSDGACSWALPHLEFDEEGWAPGGYDVPAEYRDLADALYRAMNELHGYDIAIGEPEPFYFEDTVARRLDRQAETRAEIARLDEQMAAAAMQMPPALDAGRVKTAEEQFQDELKKLGYIK